MLLKLLSLPITLPIDGIRFTLERIAELADRELMDDSVVREQLLLLQLQLEEGEIDEEEYVARESELVQRLREIRESRQQLEREQADENPDDVAPARRRFIVETAFEDEDRS